MGFRWMAGCAGLAVVLAAGAAGAAEPFTLTIDTAASVAQFRLCALGSCDVDVSPVAGSVIISLDGGASPTSANVYDYMFELTQPVAFQVPIFLGSLAAMATNVSLEHPAPGTVIGPAPIAGGAFSLADAPVAAFGAASYVAGGLVCIGLQGAGLPCADTIDLNSIGVQTADNIDGQIAVVGTQVTVVLNATITVPVLADQPDLATLTFTGFIVARGQLPVALPGDFNGNGLLELFDWGAFLACDTWPGGGIITPACAIMDFDGDLDVDAMDYGAFQLAFTGVP
ncbi:MAG: hypothetical protein HOP29_12195 [Phycisphaerales bacterium]|nr:hypothetical protein [Phycisphaerales bacterium]